LFGKRRLPGSGKAKQAEDLGLAALEPSGNSLQRRILLGRPAHE
jgi:hypothetical protein